jgi:glycosyltransferase involved in cell wall biosynthesis
MNESLCKAQQTNMKKRLLLVSLNPFFGGGEIHFVKLAKMLAERYRVHALVADPETAQRLRATDADITQLCIPAIHSVSIRYFDAARKLRSLLHEFRPHAVHFNGQGESYLAVFALIHGVPFSVARHTQFDNSIATWKRWLVLRSLRAAAGVVCVSKAIEHQLLPFVPATKLHVIPNWLESLPEPKPAYELSSTTAFRLLYLGRIECAKGIFELLAAMPLLKNVSLDVVGDGIALKSARAASSGMPVIFHGFKTECASFYRQADLLVFPSHSEGQGLVVMEAMAYGLPCLVSNIDAVLETTCGEQAAEVFQVGNAIDLAHKIEFLRTHPERLRELQAAGIERVHRNYTLENARLLYYRLFDNLIRLDHASSEMPR